MEKLVRHVSIRDLREDKVIWTYLSNFCPDCGRQRGKPQMFAETVEGRTYRYHRWVNECGHQDDENKLFAEMESQCEVPECTLLRSMYFDPYCGPECANRAAAALITTTAGVVNKLDAVMHRVQGFQAIMEHCPFTSEASEVKHHFKQVESNIQAAQQAISAAVQHLGDACRITSRLAHKVHT